MLTLFQCTGSVEYWLVVPFHSYPFFLQRQTRPDGTEQTTVALATAPAVTTTLVPITGTTSMTDTVTVPSSVKSIPKQDEFAVALTDCS